MKLLVRVGNNEFLLYNVHIEIHKNISSKILIDFFYEICIFHKYLNI
jgi:hypothetical protein